MSPAPTAARSRSGQWQFSDPDALAAAIPGGVYGFLPLGKLPFGAKLRITELGHGFSVRSVETHGPVAIRSELTATWPAIAYLLPSLGGAGAVFDGREIGGRTIASRIIGHTPTMRTFAPNQIGSFTVATEGLRRAADALTGQSRESILVSPATIIEAKSFDIARLRTLHSAAGELLQLYSPDQLEFGTFPALSALRDEILAIIIQGLVGNRVKHDHLARQLQTRSMAKIDAALDEHSDTMTSMQALCRITQLPVRTIETIVRLRTGFSALEYVRLRRLMLARKALQMPSAETSVTSVAMQFGFWHLGRFSQYYHRAYGELPSLTLAHALGKQVANAR